MMKIFLLLPVILLLTSCFGGGGEIPQDHYYRLAEVKESEIKTYDSGLDVVAVSIFKSDALHRERAILYSYANQPLSLERYHYHHWTQTPGQMIQENLLDYLRKAKFARRVVRYGEEVSIDANINGYIKRFERIIDANKIKVRVSLELHLETLRQQRQSYQWNYEHTVEAEDDSMHATVQALSAGLQSVYDQFLEDVSRQKLN